ncbi:unnamed protein product [Clonostachys rosea]|uniref:Uncharacterized protein n=1 Tax=Bionectria ochroleuca TaxID=29856 RepID=A0ABY6TY71_BIOOC|nr:unnamed protein product [Clonostachys rosea]
MGEPRKPRVPYTMVESLRGPNYVFQRALPDVTDASARRRYMDTFIRHVMSVRNDQITDYRIHVTIVYLRFLIRNRYRWVAEDWLSCMLDLHVWNEMFQAHPLMKVWPTFPWTLITHDRSSNPSRMYMDFREFHFLDNDPCKDLRDDESTDRQLESELGVGLMQHRDELVNAWKSEFEAFGEDPVMLTQPGLNPEAPPFRPEVTAAIPAPRFNMSLIRTALDEGPMIRQGDINEHAMPHAQESSSQGTEVVVIHPALVDLWDGIKEYRNWSDSGLVASAWEIRLPHERVTNMLLPNRKTIETHVGEGTMAHIVRRGTGGRTYTLAIEISQHAASEFSAFQKSLIRNMWKRMLRWIITIVQGAMIPWETWSFLWEHQLYVPMKANVSEADTWYELIHVMQVFRQNRSQEMLERNLSQTQALDQFEDALVANGHTIEQMNRRLVELVSSTIPPNHRAPDIQALVNAICLEGYKFAQGAELDKRDDFFMFAMSAIYIIAQRNLEREEERHRHFAVAKALYSVILEYFTLTG